MSKFLTFVTANFKKVFLSGAFLLLAFNVAAQQVPNSNFEDWSAAAFNGEPQAKGWNASNVEQVGMKFNFAHRETGRNGGYCMMVQDQDVGAMGITETSPGYFSLGQPWAYLPSITAINQATAGTYGGIAWTSRPDTMSVWIKRTGNNNDKEDFYLLFYSWNGKTRGDKFKGKNGSCTSVTYYDEESDVRQAVNGNECGTTTQATQVSEGYWRERNTYGQWTNIRVPIFYMNNTVPTTMNIIFSASNYPNFRANNGLYAGNSLYVDDVQLIYSSKIHTLIIDGKEWKGFDPNSSDVQTYSLGESATTIPTIEAMRGAGSITNTKNKTVTFAGRTLSGSEITITKGNLTNQPTVITVRAEDGSSTTTYKIQFVKAASSNAKLASISVNGSPVEGFSPTKYTYNVNLPFGTTAAPVITAEGQEDGQTIAITQPTSPNGTATIKVTAANKTASQTYTLNFSIAALADNTLKDILVNGKSVPGFSPNQTTYKVSLPVGTTALPTIVAVSNYPAGAQTIEYVLPTLENLDGGSAQIKVTTPGNPTPKVYKLNFRLEASSYSKLGMIYLDGEEIADFLPEQYTYYKNLPLGTTALPAITWTKGDEYQTVTLSQGGLDGTTRITVVAGNGDQTVYKLIFSTEKSEISTLAGIKVGGVLIDGFTADQTTYDYPLPIGTTELPAIEPVKGDEYQNYTINYGGVNGTTRITVTAGNGNTTVYVINFSVDSYTNNTLRMIYVGGVALEGFSSEKNEYYYNLEKGTTALPEITFDKQDENLQTVTVRSGGLNGDYRITVRPQSGASRTYVIHFSVATSSNTALAMIRLDGVNLEGFHPDTTHYTIVLPEGVSSVPAVTFDKAEASQRVLSVLEDTTQLITVTAESGAKRVYTLDFRFQLSANAFLEMIYLDGDSLEGFLPDQANYEVQLTGAICPAVTVDKAAGQQVTISSPVGAGKAVILVSPEQGAPMQYTITFLPAALATVQLQSISLNGTPLATFAPGKTHYTENYSDALPAITWSADEGLSVNLLWSGETAYLHVADAAGAKAVYDIVFTRQYAGNVQLASIQADGVELPDFAPARKHYTYPLEAGSTYPTLSYVKSADNQVVTFGQTAEGEWTFVVKAENGDTTAYTVRYEVALYADATLANIELLGLPDDQTFVFVPATFDYNGLVLDEGALLPDVQITARPRQKVLSYNVSKTEQRVLVIAENGAKATYTIHYTRKQSNNALLADILIDGKPLLGFLPNTYHYTVTLPQGTKVTPNVFPVGQLDNQTITTYLSNPNGVTAIHVEAQDGTTADYSVAFNVQKSSNTALADLYLESEEVEVNFKPNTTEYIVEMPYLATECPLVVWEKAEQVQRVDFVSRPLGDTTKVIVTAENGDTREYCIFFRREILKNKNLLSMIRITELDQELSLKDKTKRDFDVEIPFGTRSLTIEYEKSYPEQTVFIQPGGVHHPTVITVKANNDTVPDEIYTIIPSLQTSDPAVLTDIKVNGSTIPGFSKDQFSYIVPVTEKPILRYTMNKGAEINILEQTTKRWKAEVTYGEGANARTNTYDVWYYYENDIVPNMDFKQWTNAATTTSAKKPTGWNVLADFAPSYTYLTFTFTPGEEVKQDGTNDIAYMHTQYNSVPLAGYIPGYMTLGTITYHYQRWGSSAFSISGGITYRNTPDVMSVRYRNARVHDNSCIIYTLNGSGGEKEIVYTDSNTSTNFIERNISLKEANEVAEVPTQLNITFNSFESESGKNGTAGGEAEMYVDWLKFSYNHTLTSMQVDAISAVKSGNAFTATLTDPERIEIPILSFTGEVPDQAQKVVWNNNGKEQISGNTALRSATITNYAENGTDNSTYTLKVYRPLDTRNQLNDLKVGGVSISGFNPATLEYNIHVAPTTTHFPDIVPVPTSSLQTVTTSFDGSTMTITVKPEKGSNIVYKVHFIKDLSNKTTLKSLNVGDEYLNVEERNHTISTTNMSDITFTKESDGQTVVVNDGVITVTAENGDKDTYTITRVEPVVTTSGKIAEFELGGNIMTDLGGNTYSCERERTSDTLLFSREYPQDSVVFTQSEAKMEWKVFGSESHTYTYSYPTSQSSNAQLENILINGEEYSEFIPSAENYTLHATDIQLEVITAESKQTVAVVQTEEEDDVEYAITVTAEDGAAAKTYRLRVKPLLSDDNTLANIMVDGVAVAGFDPDSLNYTIVIPSPAVKTVQPQMPSISYMAGHSGQTIEMTQGDLGELNPTLINVTSEQGYSQEYSVTVLAEPSRNVELTGIMVNGIALEGFEAGRHYYSIEVETDVVEITATSEDRFQTIEILHSGSDSIIHVVAEDGVTTTDYHVNIYAKMLSDDATLASILLDGNDFSSFIRELNPRLEFKPMQNTYTINLPSGTTTLPEIAAQLKMEGQQVSVSKSGMVVTISVKAVDGTPNDYVLTFETPKSRNANLSMIFLNGDSLADFTPDYYFYQVQLPVGVHELPEVAGQKGESHQTIMPAVVDSERLQTAIEVKPEDPTANSSTYVIAFHYTQSAADTLQMLYVDGDSLKAFAPQTFFYSDSLPVGTTAFPELSWEEADEWQTIRMDTVLSDATNLIRQVFVTAENGKSNTYTVSYAIRKSNIDTLQMIFVNQKQLPDFDAQIEEYSYTLTSAQAAELDGALPTVEFIKGDEYQTVLVSQAPDTLIGKSLGYKSLVSVTAATGAMRTYTIHYPVERSSDATLNMIMLGGKPLPGFDAERYSYRLEIEGRNNLPVVSVVKKEEAQTYEIFVNEDTVRVEVTAEDGGRQTYTLSFERLLSSNTQLANIEIAGHREFRFIPDEYEYLVVLPYGEDTIPAFSVMMQDSLQTVPETFPCDTLENGDIHYTIVVTAANGDEGNPYMLTFRFTKNNDARLLAIYVDSVLLEDFKADVTEYELYHPYGTDSTAFYGVDNIAVELSDPEAEATVSIGEDGTLYIRVVAANGETENTYTIRQMVSLDTDNWLSAILLDGDTIRGFDPEVTFYTHLLVQGQQPPTIDAICRSANAEVTWRAVSAGDTCRITCTAEDGSDRVYYVYFAISVINQAATPTTNDVLLKRIPGSLNIFVATIRKDVSIALYDQYGHLVCYEKVPVADPNDVSVSDDPNTIERLNDVTNLSSGLVIPLIPGQIYQYAFYVSDKQKLSSGKFIAW